MQITRKHPSFSVWSKSTWLKGLVQWILFGLSFQTLLPAQSQVVDSLKIQLAQAKHDTARARLSNKIGSAFFITNMDSAQAWWEKGMALGEMLAEDEDSTVREKGQRILMSASNNIAVVAQYRGLYPLALRNYQRCIRIAIALKDKRGLTLSVNNIGLIKKEQGKFQDALDHFVAAHRLSTQIADSQLIGSTLNNIGTAYLKLKEDKLALRYFQKSLAYSIKLVDQVQEVDNRINIGSLFLDFKKPDSALMEFRTADSLAVLAEYEIGRPEILLGIGKCLEAKGLHLQAIAYVQQAIDLSNQLDLPEVTVSGLEILAELQEKNGLSAAANQTLHAYIDLKDSLMNTEKLLEFGQLETSFAYERDEYEAALAQEKRAAEIRDLQFKQYLTAFAALCGFVLLMLIATRWVKRPFVRKMLVFASLLFFFEFVLVVVDSVIDGFTGGLPVPKLLVNILLAAMIAPAHSILERLLMKRQG